MKRMAQKIVVGMLAVPAILAASALPAAAADKKDPWVDWKGDLEFVDGANSANKGKVEDTVALCLGIKKGEMGEGAKKIYFPPGMTCDMSYNDKDFTKFKTDARKVSDEYGNGTAKVSDRTLTWSDSVSSSDTLSLSVSAESTVFDVVKVNVTTTYSKTWTKESTVSDSPTVTVEPCHVSWFEREAEMGTVKGDVVFTIKGPIMNKMIVVQNADFTAPTGNGYVNSRDRVMTAEERAGQACAANN